MSTVESTDGTTQSSRVDAAREPSQNSSADSSSRSPSHLTMLLAGLWTMVADFLAVAEDHVDRARNADTVGEAVAETNRSARQFATQAPFMQKMRVIGAAAITIVLIIVVLSMLYNMDIVQNANGPFADLIDEYVGYIGAALTLIGMGLIAYAANTVMGAFGGGGMGGGR